MPQHSVPGLILGTRTPRGSLIPLLGKKLAPRWCLPPRPLGSSWKRRASRAVGVTDKLGHRHLWLWRALSALLAFQLTATPLASALPHGAQIVGGSATLSQAGTTLQITQGTPKAIINWT